MNSKPKTMSQFASRKASDSDLKGSSYNKNKRSKRLEDLEKSSNSDLEDFGSNMSDKEVDD